MILPKNLINYLRRFFLMYSFYSFFLGMSVFFLILVVAYILLFNPIAIKDKLLNEYLILEKTQLTTKKTTKNEVAQDIKSYQEKLTKIEADAWSPSEIYLFGEDLNQIVSILSLKNVSCKKIDQESDPSLTTIYLISSEGNLSNQLALLSWLARRSKPIYITEWKLTPVDGKQLSSSIRIELVTQSIK